MTIAVTPDETRPRIGAPLGQVFAWASLAAINAGFLAATVPMPAGGAQVRVLHHLYDAGQLLALGFLLSGLFDAWGRWGPRRRWLGLPALFALAFGAGFFVLANDLDGAAGALFGPLWLSLSLLIAGAAMTIPLAVALGSLLSKKWFLIPIGVLLGAGVAVANQLLLQNDYPGIHFYLAWVGASLIGMSVSGLSVPWVLVRKSASRLVASAFRAVLIVAAATSVVVWPGSTVALEIFKVQGAVVIPLLARLRALEEGSAAIPLALQPWFEDRSNAPDQPPTEPPLIAKSPIVVVLVVDCMRADLIEGDAHAKVLPNMIALRDAGVHFTAARSSAPATTQSIASLFLGKYYSGIYWELATIGKDPRVYPKADTSIRFPDVLKSASIPTVVITGLSGLVNAYGIVGGFSEEVVVRSSASASEVMKKVIDRIEKAGDGPLFLYVHVADAHAPYDRAGKEGSELERYIGELGIVDEGLGRLLKTIDERGLAGRTSIIVTADHGEAFGEHGSRYHGKTLYEEEIRVPLLLRVPGRAPRRIATPVGVIDIAPTLFELAKLPRSADHRGRSLVAAAGGAPLELHPVFAEILPEDRIGARSTLVHGEWKLHYDERRNLLRLFNLKEDPGEKVNRLRRDGLVASELAAKLFRWRARHVPKSPAPLAAQHVPSQTLTR